MSLDPAAAEFLRRFAAMRIPPLSTLTPEQARAQVVIVPTPLEPVAMIEDRLIPGPAGEIPLQIYHPLGNHARGGAAPPAVVFFHGGGWVVSNIEAYDGLCRSLANASGCVFISVEYRLAPEHKFPAAVEDSYAATVWTVAHAAELGADPNRVAVAGDSAGGNLATAVCLMAKARAAPQLAYQVLVYPITNYSFDTPSYRENGEGYFLTKDMMAWFWKQYLAREEDGNHRFASPLQAPDLADLPPALVITAQFDPLRDEGEAYARRLQAAGVPVELQRCEGMIHGFLRRTDLYSRAGELIQSIGQTLRKELADSIRG